VQRTMDAAVDANLAHVSGKAHMGRATIRSSIYSTGPRPSGLVLTYTNYARQDPPTIGPPNDPHTLPLFPYDEPDTETTFELERVWHPGRSAGAGGLAY
jgi:hypothetical protein